MLLFLVWPCKILSDTGIIVDVGCSVH